MDWLSQPLCLLVIFGTIYSIFELFVRRDERKMIIDKSDSGSLRQQDYDFGLSRLLPGERLRPSRFISLRIGLVALGIGLGFAIGAFCNFMVMCILSRQHVKVGIFRYYDPSVVYTASICIFGGLCLLLSYVIERHSMRKNSSDTSCNKRI